jgi:hypothetical protein
LIEPSLIALSGGVAHHPIFIFLRIMKSSVTSQPSTRSESVT